MSGSMQTRNITLISEIVNGRVETSIDLPTSSYPQRPLNLFIHAVLNLERFLPRNWPCSLRIFALRILELWGT